MLDPMQRAFLQHVQGFFNPETLAKMRSYFIERDAMSAAANLDERQKNAIQRGESSDAVRLQEHWYTLWQDAEWHPQILATLHPYTYVAFPPQVRNVQASSHKVPWHQDVGYMRLLGNRGHEQVMTCFVPLEPHPAQCTTIQFALDNMHDARELPHEPMDAFGAGIKEDNFTHLLHYNLQLGDALLFGDFTVHRTYTPAGCQMERRSLEFRLLQPKHAIEGKDYFDLEQKKFIKFKK